jgi:hypothetical protein
VSVESATSIFGPEAIDSRIIRHVNCQTKWRHIPEHRNHNAHSSLFGMPNEDAIFSVSLDPLCHSLNIPWRYGSPLFTYIQSALFRRNILEA